MSIVMPANFGPQGDSGPMFRLTVGQYQELIDAGIIDPDEPVELLEGLLFQKMTKYPPHTLAVMLTRTRLECLRLQGFHVRSQDPITLTDGKPEPDVVVARGSMLDYGVNDPTANDVALVIEVAESSLVRDRGVKLRSYARAGIAEYWIINLIEQRLEVFKDPAPQAKPHSMYRQQSVLGRDDHVNFTIAGVPATLSVCDLLPPI